MAYADLLSDIADTLDRDDVETRLPRWLKLVEARLNRLLDDPEMEVSTPLTGDGASLPADFGSMVSIGTADGNALQQMGSAEYAGIRPVSGTSRFYTIQDGKIYYVPGSANVTLVYRRTVPPLTVAAPTNWLLERAPDVYLFGVLAEAEEWDGNSDQAERWLLRFNSAVDELRADAIKRKWGAGAISPRIRRV